MDNNAVALNTSLATPSRGKEAGLTKRAFKSVPDNYRVLSEAKYHKVVEDLEAILLDISTDGIGINTCVTKQQTELTGACRELISGAAETTSPSVVATRFRNPDYVVGLAFQVVGDDALDCDAPQHGCF